jgi:hypothetical protein
MKFPYQHELARYYKMPKDFVGPNEADVLISMHETMLDAKSSWMYQFVAGSAAAESGLMATHLPTRERHARLRAAESAWRTAQDTFIMNRFSDGWSDERLYTIPDRIEMHRAFLEVYRDMVDGDVKSETLIQTHERLVGLANANLDHHNRAEKNRDYGAMTYRRGLAYELGTILTITRLGCPSLFAVPVPARADHGEHYPEQTHDVRLIQQSWGQINWCIPYEVKPMTPLQPDRYESALVRGRIELLMPSTTEPLDIVRYMKEEVEGTISEQHLAELNEITSRVFRLAQEYKQRHALAGVALSA